MLCKNCKNDFIPSKYKKQQFCSNACRFMGHRKTATLSCSTCSKPFILRPNEAKHRKFCSKSCFFASQLGREVKESTRLLISTGNYKGEQASYSAKHKYMINKYGKGTKCSDCGVVASLDTRIEWANISGKYKRTIDDWKQLCTRCHSIFDGKVKPFKESTCLTCRNVFKWKGNERKGLFCSKHCWYTRSTLGGDVRYKEVIALKRSLV